MLVQDEAEKLQEEKLEHYMTTVNTLIQEMQSKKLYEFIRDGVPYIEDYHLDYTTHTETLKDAETLDEIFVSGFQDLASIVLEDGLGIKEYDTTKEEKSSLIDICEEMDEKFPFYLELQIEKSIKKEIQELEAKGEIDTPYCKKLIEIDSKIEEIQDIFTMRFKTQNRLRSLEWKITQILLAVSLASISREISKFKEIQKLESQVQKACKKIVKIAKKHDKKMKTLEHFKKKDMSIATYTVYQCPRCKESVVINQIEEVSSTSSICPKCNTTMQWMGEDVPFEFLSFFDKILEATKNREENKDANSNT